VDILKSYKSEYMRCGFKFQVLTRAYKNGYGD